MVSSPVCTSDRLRRCNIYCDPNIYHHEYAAGYKYAHQNTDDYDHTYENTDIRHFCHHHKDLDAHEYPGCHQHPYTYAYPKHFQHVNPHIYTDCDGWNHLYADI